MSLHAKLYRFAENTREERTREKVYTMIVINYKLTSLISVDSFLIKINDLTLSNKVQSFTYQLALLCPEITAWGFFDIGIQLIPAVGLQTIIDDISTQKHGSSPLLAARGRV